MKLKQENMSDQGLDQSNPSGAVQAPEEMQDLSKKFLRSLKTWAKKNQPTESPQPGTPKQSE